MRAKQASYEVLFEPDSVEHVQGLRAGEASTVLREIEVQLTREPEVETRNRKRLRPNPLAPWELRIGDLRVFYDVEARPSCVRIVAVGRKQGERLLIGREEVRL